MASSRPWSTSATATARSQTSGAWVISPKSTIPLTRRSSLNSTLSRLISPWITCARSPGSAPGHLAPASPRPGRQGTHHRQARIHSLDVAESGGLHRQDGPVIRRIRDLEQEALPGGRVHPEVLVPFAREGLEGRRLNAEAFPQDLPGCLLAEGRRRALQGVRALHHRPEGYLAAHRPATARPRCRLPT